MTTIQVSLSLDSDGFLRRHCGACDREFKWLQTPEDEDPAYKVDRHLCPYCGLASDEFWTEAQANYLTAVAVEETVGPALDELESAAKQLNRAGGLIKMSVTRSGGTPVRPLASEDMRRVDFLCHPEEPVKVVEEWEGPVHCLTCGELTSHGGTAR